MDVDDTIMEKLSSACTHNMDSEEVMGMFSANQVRAPHAPLLFTSSKIRAKKNKTLEFLSEHPDVEMTLRKAVPAAAKLRQRVCKSVADLQKEMSQCIMDKIQKRDQTDLEKMERQVLDLLSSENPDYVGAFPSLNSASVDILQDILKGAVVGQKFLHNWNERRSHSSTTYFGRIEKLKVPKTKNCKKHYIICYWEQTGDYVEDGEDYNIQLQELAMDYIQGDVQFIE